MVAPPRAARGRGDRGRDWLVARADTAGDRRIVRARITAAGLTLLADLDAPVGKSLAHLLGGLGEPRLRSFVSLLGAARELV